jgi:hypothetical protein
MAVRSKAQACGRSLAGIVGSKPDRGMGCECCVLSGRDLCDGPISRTVEYYRARVCVYVYVCVVECDQVQQPSTTTMSR